MTTTWRQKSGRSRLRHWILILVSVQKTIGNNTFISFRILQLINFVLLPLFSHSILKRWKKLNVGKIWWRACEKEKQRSERTAEEEFSPATFFPSNFWRGTTAVCHFNFLHKIFRDWRNPTSRKKIGPQWHKKGGNTFVISVFLL